MSAVLSGKEWAKLSESFHNSHANLTLNYLLRRSGFKTLGVYERASVGHRYYPFPGYRTGPSLEQIVRFNPYTDTSASLLLFKCDSVALQSNSGLCERQLFAMWSGVDQNDISFHIPVHPWAAVNLSKQYGCDKLCLTSITVRPLISQRTVRVQSTGYDLKLPVAATLTGERRLFHEINFHNAVTVSSMAKLILAGSPDLDIQADVATIRPTLVSHWPTDIGAIVREPVVKAPHHQHSYCAIEFWDRAESSDDFSDAYGVDVAWLEQYALQLIRGVIMLYSSGIAVEPHLQNVLLVFDNQNDLTAIKVRDLDGAILRRGLFTDECADMSRALHANTWAYMCDYELGLYRMCHSLVYGHLNCALSVVKKRGRQFAAEVVNLVEGWFTRACRECGLKSGELTSILQAVNVKKCSLKMHLNGATTNKFAYAHC